MAEAYKKLYQGVLTTSATTVYTAPAATQVVIRSMRAVNVSTTASVNLTIWQSGTTNSNLLLPPTPIDAGGFAEYDGVIVLAAADTIAASASAGSLVTLTIHGLEIS